MCVMEEVCGVGGVCVCDGRGVGWEGCVVCVHETGRVKVAGCVWYGRILQKLCIR